MTSLDGECKGGPPNKGTWFKLDVYVRDSIAMIELDGKHLVSTKPHYQTYSKGGSYAHNCTMHRMCCLRYNYSLECITLWLNFYCYISEYRIQINVKQNV